MGIVANIDHVQFPKQGRYLGKRTEVCFKYDTAHILMGTIIRDDTEAPGELIIQLDDGRVLLAGECMYSPKSDT